MKTCIMMVTTDERIYSEQYSKVIKAICRASDIVNHENIIAVDIIDNTTGEVLYRQGKGNVPHIADALIEAIYVECL